MLSLTERRHSQNTVFNLVSMWPPAARDEVAATVDGHCGQALAVTATNPGSFWASFSEGVRP